MHRSGAAMAWNVFQFCTALRGLGSIMILLVLGVVGVTYYVVVLTNYGPALYDGGFDSLIALSILILFHFLLVMLLWSYFSVVLTDPGSVPPNWRPAIDEERGEADPLNGSDFSNLPANLANQRIRFCRKCNQLKPPRCHHCSVCGRCVLKMDHHCVWVVNCVGALNYKYFLLFLFYTFLETSLVTLSLLPHLRALFTDGEIPGTPGTLATTFLAFVLNLAFALSVIFYTFLETSLVTLSLLPHLRALFTDGEIPGTPGTLATTFLAFVLNLAFALSVMMFLIMHIRLVAANTTTIEAYEKKTTPKWRYDLGRKKNFEQVGTTYNLSTSVIQHPHMMSLVWTSDTGLSLLIQKKIFDGYQHYRGLNTHQNLTLIPRSSKSHWCHVARNPELVHGFERFSMQRGTGGQDDFFHRRDLLGNFWGFGSRQRMMPSLFGDRDVFDDPFFTPPFGSLFDSGMFGSSASAVGKDQTNRAAGIVIEELNSDDEGKLEEDEDGPGAGKDIRQKHSSSSKEPFVEHPDDDPDGTKSNILIHSNDRNKVEGAQSQSRVSVQTSRVTYGGVDGAYYTSTRTTKRGTDGVVLEETQEADRITGQAKHSISRGIQDKGHSVTRKLNSDGKVDTLQTLHNLDEDELADFEENWKGKGNLSGWEDRLHMKGNGGKHCLGFPFYFVMRNIVEK
ncbi:putative protein S-acyltransferase 14 [Morella rubra]|uniref:S-acyltransferase n=1 Tax=Morella rubra TaxID=262757 RepID=A0A6A1W3N7_9ROSI|nr:putative protein S-acyltransferase 14 [Morella rubra]